MTSASNTLKNPTTLPILYQDDHCIAINKPAGMLVHRSWLATHETQFAMQTLRDQIGQHVFPVHRLDRPTSGVLLFALDSVAARTLSQQFEPNAPENLKVQKTYWAVVRGWLATEAGSIDYPLSVIKDKIADKHSSEHKEDQHAKTGWQMLANTEQPFQARSRYATSRYSWVALTPHTGRKHQLRRHMKHIFHPILGDTSYGDHHQNRAIRQHVGVSRLMLHARTLSFTNALQQRIRITAPVDNDWETLHNHFGWGTLTV